jgi:hypothetical protein
MTEFSLFLIYRGRARKAGPSPVRLAFGSLRVTVAELIVAPKSGATYSVASLRMTELFSFPGD